MAGKETKAEQNSQEQELKSLPKQGISTLALLLKVGEGGVCSLKPQEIDCPDQLMESGWVLEGDLGL